MGFVYVRVVTEYMLLVWTPYALRQRVRCVAEQKRHSIGGRATVQSVAQSFSAQSGEENDSRGARF